MSLSDSLLAADRRPQVVTDLAAMIDAEVKDKKGLSGGAIKAGYAAVRKFNPTVTSDATNRMLPEVATALQPFWDDFSADRAEDRSEARPRTGGEDSGTTDSFGGAGDFGDYLAGRGDETADALLAVTDKRAAATDREPLRRAYKGLRGKAKDNVKQALPRLGKVIQQHAS